MKNVRCAKCTKCGREYEALPGITTCACGGILDIEYHYDYIKSVFSRESLARCGDYSMWRYRPFLPVEPDSPPTPLRVGWSPLYRADALARALGLHTLYIKDDGQNPTASLKDRASAMAVVKAREAGADTIACSSTGNAASSLAGNAAAAGFKTYIFVPSRAPKGKVAQLMIFGATVISVDGSYEDTFELSKAAIDKWGWYNRNAAINPYLSEGKKTVTLEIMEQLHWQVPDYIALSVGDGCTIAGAWKGLKDLYAAGFIDRLPKLISVQAEGCCPLNRAIATGEPWTPMEENTLADSIAVGVPRNADKALAAIRESQGVVVNVSDEEILAAMRLLGRTCGVFGEPAGVTGTAGVRKALELSLIDPDSSVVSVVTGNGLKDTANGIRAAGEPMLVKPEMGALLSAFGARDIRP
ncbi:threonine synthase [Pseudoflavonifractor sp. BIOML-A6]|nr:MULTISPECIES: threonine synthase [unclassified Pseudoflavonifractor]MTQ98533.1 threonine synthase [Pseudoflavonifractor sp. BIOML-A16]MTR07716.1 threonine synthase [Pseudoflavonifractor sp. BIOML-A15]MTR74593.1 threonine synthase [Pseudoflavonifractor sp. BIOML-A18]MTS66016.1 threonine synthase [Pseudoflavonifractor sp. BIOML-A5]MTS73435.1 threonine synthase [Pseudoflavonifractor sp. BIOML-A8]MTS92828.1 threonine synthase [Pseudoflavonifractor sp. BIOML-A4]